MNAENISATLIVPGLMRLREKMLREALQQISQERLPALELILARSSQVNSTVSSFEGLLFDVFGLPNSETSDVPVGAITNYLQYGAASRNWYLRADPVYMQPNRDHLLLLGNNMIDISDKEAEQLTQDINKTYSDMPWQIKMLSARQWVIETEQPVELQTHPLSFVAGKNINDYLPSGRDAAGWQALLNELQMFLHSHPVNRAREMKGFTPVNSVWFWGAGQMPQLDDISGQKHYVQCWSQHAVALGLARLCNVPRVDLPDSGDAWLKQAITPGNHLLVVDDLNTPAPMTDPYDWWQALVNMERIWFQPLLSALQNNTVMEIWLMDDTGQRYLLTRSMSKYWWKRVKALV